MLNNSISVEDYNLDLAIQARKILIYETHPNEEITKIVWGPTIELLRELESLKPESIYFLATPPCSKGSVCFVDIVGPKNRVAYIGTIHTKHKALEEWRKLFKIYSMNQDKVEKLAELGWAAIRRDHNGCYIPLESYEIEEKTLEEGLRRYLQTFAPGLSKKPIKWIEKKTQLILEREIATKAKEISKPSSKEESDRILIEDSEEFLRT